MKSWIIPVTVLAVGAAGGYISGKSSAAGGSALVPENSSGSRTRSSSRVEASVAAEPTKKSRRADSTEQIARMPGNSNRVQALMDFYAGLTPEQLAEEASKLESLPMNERMIASSLLFGRWAEVDPTAAMAFSNTMGMAGGFVRPTILQSWASVDPANAAKYFAENPREFAMMGGGRGPMGGQDAASIIAGEWARQDPAAALAWASSLTSGKGQAMTVVIGEIAKTDPRKAADMIGKMDQGDQAGAYRAVAAQYGALDFKEAQTWIGTLPAEEQAAARASAIRGFSANNPEEAAKHASAMEAGDAKDQLISDLIPNLARRDPQAAAEWLKQQDSERAQRDGMDALMPALIAKNPNAGLIYANSFEEGRVRDSAIQQWVMNNHTGEPVDLIIAGETITDEGDRNRAIGMSAMRWMREDSVAAKAYIEASTTIPDDVKQRIIEGRGMWGGRRGGPRGGN